MLIRRFRATDARKVSDMIVRTLRTTNAADYSEDYIERIVARMQPDALADRAARLHFYVAKEKGAIVACGAIGPHEGKEDESSLVNVFVCPERQGRGIGRRIVETLEQDDWFLRAHRVVVPASLTGVRFYLSLGYDYCGGIREPDGEGLILLEKRRTP